MNSDRLKKVEEIYHRTLEIDENERDSFLKESCGDDLELRREVESLLSFSTSSDDLLENPPGSLAAEMFAGEQAEDLTGRRIGHYRIEKLLGRGGMGEVYLAEDVKLERPLALKILPPEFVAHEERLSRFVREARSASALNHPNIITIYEIDEFEGTHFIAAEYIEGQTLGEYAEGISLNIEALLEIAVQIASALAEAHTAGIIHRDIKPDNIMIRPNGLVKILDFGIAKPISDSGFGISDLNPEGETLSPNPKSRIPNPESTMPGKILGTARYMSPEQAEGRKVDPRTDIYSFGVVLYELLTGRTPAENDKDFLPVHESAEDCPEELENIIRKMLAKDPADRFQTARELLARLNGLQNHPDVAPGGRQISPVSAGKQLPIFKTDDDESRVTTPHNLSENIRPIIGREKEIAEVTKLLKREDVRLLTLTGIGGTGKTRLARAVAGCLLEDFAAGVFFVDLASVTDHQLVVPTIADTLGIKESGRRQIPELLKNYLQDRQILLIIDNLEQVIEAENDLIKLLDPAAGLKILVTSRESLRLGAGREYPVRPLAVPENRPELSLSELSKNEAVRFFVERARLAQPDFLLAGENAGAVAEVCRRLEGLPLALELAAARIKLFSPAALLTRLSNSPDILTGGPKHLPARRRTMHGAIAWSYDLLEASEKNMFNRLAVFAGGFTLEAAEAVVFGGSSSEDAIVNIYDGLSSLLDKSLIIRDAETVGEPRLRMLVVVREFALKKMSESRAAFEIGRRHAEFYAGFSEDAGTSLEKGVNEAEWLDKLGQEHDNLRAALAWSLENVPRISLRIVVAIYRFWARRAFLAEGSKWIKLSLEANEAERDTELLLAGAYNGIGYLSRMQGDLEAAESFIKESLRLSREFGDNRLIGVVQGDLGIVKLLQNDLVRAKDLLENSLLLCRETDDRIHVSSMLNNLGEIARQQGDYEAAREFYGEALTIRQQESLKSSVAVTTLNLASVACLLKDCKAARTHALKALKIYEELGDKIGIANALDTFAAASDKTERSAKLLGAARAIYEATGYKEAAIDGKFMNTYQRELQAALGDERFEAAFENGKSTQMKKAIALAREGSTR
jgi:predicted ATPase/serine/threonine protein kinase